MRKVQIEQIIKNRYKIYDDQVIETENGEFYSKQLAEQVLLYQKSNNNQIIEKLKDLDKEQRIHAAEKFCTNKYIELKSKNDDEFFFEDVPYKKYEIYQLDMIPEKVMLIDTKYLPEATEKEVYYSKEIANQIYDNLLELENNIENSFPELMDLCQQEIIEIQEKIEILKKEDNEKFCKDVTTYNFINKSEIYQNMKNNFEATKKELAEANETIRSLLKKLRFALNQVEKMQTKKQSFFEKILLKIKVSKK